VTLDNTYESGIFQKIVNVEFHMFKLRNHTQFGHHKGWLVFTLAVLFLALALSINAGSAKAFADISWLDILGEGSIVLLTLAWILSALASRPPGKVTRYIVLGLGCILFSASLDLLDEFLRYPPASHWLSMIESFPAVVGMLVMTGALYLWHHEQRAINIQLRRREWDYRDHGVIDPITQLYRGEYWQARATAFQESGGNGYVAIIDINDFSYFNERYGQAEGDRYLHEVAQLLIMNLRQQDLACRYAGDRFALLLPDICDTQAYNIIQQICTSIEHVAFRHKASTDAIYTSARAEVAQLTSTAELPNILRDMLSKLEKGQRAAA
jgi:diguanylate cyclase (GGDEF)-like protein